MTDTVPVGDTEAVTLCVGVSVDVCDNVADVVAV